MIKKPNLLTLLLDSPQVDGHLVVDDTYTIIHINPAAQQLLSAGHTRLQPTVGTSIHDITSQLQSSDEHPDFNAGLLTTLLTSTLATGQPQNQAISLQNKQSEQWLLIKAIPLKHKLKTYLGLVIQDVTKTYQQDRQKTQQLAEIADQNRQWQAIFNGVQESIVLLDRAGYVVTINSATERITGYKSSQVIGKHVGQLFPKVDSAAPGLDKKGRSGIDQAMQDLRPSDLFEAIVETKDHRHIWVNYTYTPLKDPKGELTGFIRVTSDVSTVKVVDQMKNDFISIASHELRTPLGVINSYLNLFLNGQLGPLTEDQHKFMQRIYHSSGDMSALVEDLLNMSRIEDGRIDIAVQPFLMRDLVSEVISHLEPRYKAKNITIAVNVPKKPFTVHADKQKVEQALTNLIDNAIKYTYDNGTITVDIKQKQSNVIVSVTDSGVGIRPENLNHIFEKFYREGNPLSIKEGGSGLGLYISRKLIELHGGSISASSKHNHGSTFTVILPIQSAT